MKYFLLAHFISCYLFSYNIDVISENTHTGSVLAVGPMPFIKGKFNEQTLRQLFCQKNLNLRGEDFKLHIISVCIRDNIYPLFNYYSVDFFKKELDLKKPIFNSSSLDFYCMEFRLYKNKALLDKNVNPTSTEARKCLFDDPKASNEITIDEVVDLIHYIYNDEKSSRRNVIYVHCIHGMCRSRTSIAGYLLKYTDKTLRGIFNQVWRRNGQVVYHENFKSFLTHHGGHALVAYQHYLRGI